VIVTHSHPDHYGGAKRLATEAGAELVAVSRDLGWASVGDLSKRLFKERSWGAMAESETFAHLEHLRLAGRAETRRVGDTLQYELT
jgi:glyoxylase-like metal-dependent hydrolase (beta-lactamase superfamily II)